MKINLIIIILVFFLTEISAESTGDDFVVANGVTYSCQSMRIGVAQTRIMTTDGAVVKVPNHNVQAYRLNGHEYKLLPVLNAFGDTIDHAFMELITTCKGYILYRYCSNCSKYDPLNGEIAPMNHIYRYYISRNGSLKLLSNEDKAIEILSFFNVKIINDKIRK